MVREETSVQIVVGYDYNITDVYKAKDNSGKKFLGAFQDSVRTRAISTKLVGNDAHLCTEFGKSPSISETSLYLCGWK